LGYFKRSRLLLDREGNRIQDYKKQYTISVDTKKLRHRIMRIALVRLRVSQHLGGRSEGLKKYLSDAPFVMFSGPVAHGVAMIG
jgi:hypothetical protein